MEQEVPASEPPPPTGALLDDHGADADAAVQGTTTEKTIILFSDGTGNSSGKLNKTNVWRMYQAIDLGVPSKPRETVQIGRYDNGVGNSTIRLLAVLQGIFGWGLKRNVLSLYLFLCSNYRPGDRICLFGFSRGAYTMRVLADLVDKQGIIPRASGEALDYLVRDAYRAYRRAYVPRMLPMRLLVPLFRFLVRMIRDAWARRRLRYSTARNHRAPIAFLGVWDTVGAYGGPILEIIRGVDDWIMHISFNDRKLPACVAFARHALALDDERDAFQPLPWDETEELHWSPDRDPGGRPRRLEQVWFAGMHSDVGGGYPDDSLSYVSLVWMIEEARACADLRFRQDRLRETQLQADSFGRIHDSRAGLAGYYRYQPRRIGALMWPREMGSKSLVDPEQARGQGLVRPILVHDSVFRRIALGTDGYATITIPRDFEVVEDREANPRLALSEDLRARLADPDRKRDRAAAQERVWDAVWWKRVVYFTIVILSLGLGAMPLWTDPAASTAAFGGLAALVRLPIEAVKLAVPDFLDWWLDAFLARPLATLGLIVGIWILFMVSGMFERIIRGQSRRTWSELREAPKVTVEDYSPVYALRTNRAYQWILRRLRWDLLPAVFGITMLVLLAVLLASLLTIVRLTLSERSELFCRGSWSAPAPVAEFWMSTAEPCNRAPIRVAAKEEYEIYLTIPPGHEWSDGGVAALPEGVAAGQLIPPFFDHFLVGFRRTLNARWMQPLAYFVPRDANGLRVTEPLYFVRQGQSNTWRAIWVAPRHGRFAIGVNEAIPPWPFDYDFYYRGGALWPFGSPRNEGGACIRIVPARQARAAASSATAAALPTPSPCTPPIL